MRNNCEFDPLTAANNIERVESYLGYAIPASMLDMQRLGHEPLSMRECIDYSSEIMRVESYRGRVHTTSRGYTPKIDIVAWDIIFKIALAVIAGILTLLGLY